MVSDLTHLDGTPADRIVTEYDPEFTALPDATDPAPAGWTGVTDDGLAQWALTKLAGYKAERDRIRRNAQAEVERIQTKAIADEKPLTGKIDWLEAELTGYLRRIREADPKVKTYRLPGGNLVHRKGRTSTVVSDPVAFISWALDSGMDGVVKIAPQVSALTPAHGFSRSDEGIILNSATGEIVPGVQVVTGDDSYTVNLETGDES